MSQRSTPPSPARWQELYKAAIAFRDLAPWNWMDDSQVFGVQDPETQEINYCCILGNAQEMFSLNLYRGESGLAGYYHMLTGADEYFEDVMMSQNCLMASFEDRDEVLDKDIKIIKSLGLKFRGKNQWPVFRSHAPSFAPWHLTDEEARVLTIALQQAHVVAERLRKNPHLLPNAGNTYLVRTSHTTKEGLEWRDDLHTVIPQQQQLFSIAAADATTTNPSRKKSKSTKSVWEIDYFPAPRPVLESEQGDDERPYFPQIAVLCDAGNGVALGFEMVKISEIPEAIRTILKNMLENALPKEIQIRREEVKQILSPLLQDLEIRLTVAQELPQIDNLRMELRSMMGFRLSPDILNIVTGALDDHPGELPTPRKGARRSAGTAKRSQASAQRKKSDTIYQIKITLKGARPPIWRRVLIPANLRLDQLHSVLQAAMGWDGYHLHEFRVGEECYGITDPEWDTYDETSYTIQDIAPAEKCKIMYLYDFGDGWLHEVLIEKILPQDSAVRYPVCIAGKRCCPPEDSGGIGGYAQILDAVADPKHPNHKEYREWLCDDFDPEEFNMAAINRQLRTLW